MKVFLLSGKASSGKDSLGKYIKEEFNSKGENACIVRLTAPLYEYAKNYFSWDGDLNNKPREFFQEMGIEIIKNKLGKKYFLVDRLCEDIDILKNFFDVFIITDGRLVEEFIELKRRIPNIKIIHIIRENFDNKLSEKEKNHITEIDSDNYKDYDYTIYNISKENLKKEAQKIVKESENELI